ncbi:hypothetical protein C8J57DRAFT_665534 [Mycena rebaudengoi]|nr:hypothetical protein C8J57DRAFT_665534 [Mycena rebaudengoi]
MVHQQLPADPGSSTGGSRKGPSDTGTKPTSSVGAAVGGAVAGVAALALIIFAVWFYRRRKNGPAAKRATLSAFPVGYYPDDFHGRTTVGAASGALKASPSVPQALASGGSGPSMTQLIPPRKHSLRPEASSRARRDSAASAAPSYRTVYVS